MKLLTEQYAAPKSQTRSLINRKLQINEEERLNVDADHGEENFGFITLVHS